MLKELNELKKALANLGLMPEAQRLSVVIKSAQETYRIQSGDSFYSLSGGDPQYQRLIEEANPGVNPARLQLGQEIILPPKPERANASMSPSSALVSLLKKYEGKPGTGKPYLVPYDDGFGNVTAGWGHNYGPGNPARYRHLTEQRAEELLQEDIEVAASFVQRNVTPRLTQGQFDAMTSLVFNAGTGNVYNSDLFAAVNAGNFAEAARLFPTALIGENQGGLVQRRREEAAMFSS